MANINLDPNNMLTFAVRWLFAGVWGAIGWALSAHYIIPHLPV